MIRSASKRHSWRLSKSNKFDLSE